MICGFVLKAQQVKKKKKKENWLKLIPAFFLLALLYQVKCSVKQA